MIRKAIGPPYNTGCDDVMEIKSLLHERGLYEIPPYGMTPYPDEALFKSIKAFQKGLGLKVTGVIRPADEADKIFDKLKELPHVKSPIFRCPECGAPHGGHRVVLHPDPGF